MHKIFLSYLTFNILFNDNINILNYSVYLYICIFIFYIFNNLFDFYNFLYLLLKIIFLLFMYAVKEWFY